VMISSNAKAMRGQRVRTFGSVFVALLAFVVSGCSQPRPIPLGADTKYYGYIAEGRKFGVSIGDERAAAAAILVSQGFRRPEAVDCADSGLKDELNCGRGDIFDIYHRRGRVGHDVVSLGVAGGKVNRIAWSSVLFRIDS